MFERFKASLTSTPPTAFQIAVFSDNLAATPLPRLGLVHRATISDISHLIQTQRDMLAGLIQQGAHGLARLNTLSRTTHLDLPEYLRDEVAWHAPVGANARVFLTRDAVLGRTLKAHQATLNWTDVHTFSAAPALVVAKPCHRIHAFQASAHIFGYSLILHAHASRHAVPFFAHCEGLHMLGPSVATPKEGATHSAFANLTWRVQLNNRTVSRAALNMAEAEQYLANLSAQVALVPGDIIALPAETLSLNTARAHLMRSNAPLRITVDAPMIGALCATVRMDDTRQTRNQ